MADQRERRDPTVSSKSRSEAPSDIDSDKVPGTHPARAIKDADDGVDKKSYSDAPNKPDPLTVAQVEDGTDKE